MATTTTTIRVGRWQRHAAGILYVASILAILFNVWMLILSAISFANGGEVTVRLSQSDDTNIGGRAISAYFSEATVWSGAFSFWPQAWLSIARILWCLVWITVAVCVLVFSYGAYHGEVFSPRLPWLLTVAAIAVGVGGSIADWLQMWGTSTGVYELVSRYPQLQGNWTADATWTILSGLLLALLAVVFRSGSRFKRDTEGLV